MILPRRRTRFIRKKSYPQRLAELERNLATYGVEAIITHDKEYGWELIIVRPDRILFYKAKIKSRFAALRKAWHWLNTGDD